MNQSFSCLPEGAAAVAQKNHVAICHRLVGYDFSWEINRALELAILKTFCIPRISSLLQQTGEFQLRPQKRYDDTSLILGNILKWGYDSTQGRVAIERMNRIHQRFDIDNEDFLYVLSTTIYEPVRWNQQFGWRPFTEIEKHALFYFWQVVGQRMRIQNIPETYAAFERFNQEYEAQNFQFHPDNRVVGDAVVELMQGWFPAIAAPLVPVAIRAIVDEPICVALGWSKPAPAVQKLVLQSLKISRQWVRRLPPRRRARFITDMPKRSYPNGYQLEQLGPGSPTSSSSRCPFLKMQAFLKANL